MYQALCWAPSFLISESSQSPWDNGFTILISQLRRLSLRVDFEFKQRGKSA